MVTVEEMRELTETLSKMTVDERQKRFDLHSDRSDVIVPAAIVYGHLAERFGVTELVVPGGGVREGIVLELLEEKGLRRAETEIALVDDAMAFGRKFRLDEKHAVHVAKLASSLFDQLAEMHGMGSEERRLLIAAALLHDVGSVVSLKSHHKHAMYLIVRSDSPASAGGTSLSRVVSRGIIARCRPPRCTASSPSSPTPTVIVCGRLPESFGSRTPWTRSIDKRYGTFSWRATMGKSASR